MYSYIITLQCHRSEFKILFSISDYSLLSYVNIKFVPSRLLHYNGVDDLYNQKNVERDHT
jgi:hypothetical protein